MSGRTIWKFPLRYVDGPQAVEVPFGAVVLHCAAQNNVPTLWVAVTPSKCHEVLHFRVVGTGHPGVPDAGYIGTCHVGLLVWHVFQVTP